MADCTMADCTMAYEERKQSMAWMETDRTFDGR